MPSLAYRREIDGLRAVAVLAVMLYHAGLGSLPGGYLGVDTFFVISGYLITSLVLAGQAGDRFSLRRFWARRARRLVPLLMLVMLAGLIPAWLLLPAQDAEDFAQSLVAASLWLSNLLFWREDAYFGAAAEFKPLLHTWSLGVEAQFYVLFPLVLLAATRWARRALPLLLAAGVIGGLAMAEWLAARDFYAAYFLLPARAWELLAGALCASLPPLRGVLQGRIVGNAASLAGLALTLAAFVVLGEQFAPAGWGTLAVTLGAALIILFASPATVVGRVLGTRLLVWLGLVSYGAYLWHYPLLAFARHALMLGADPEPERMIALPPVLAVALLLASVALAVLTWRLVEKPFRDRRRWPARRVLPLLAVSCAIIGAFVLALLATQWQQRFYLAHMMGGRPVEVSALLSLRDEAALSPLREWTLDDGACVFAAPGLDALDMERIEQCRTRHGPALLLLGDSHAQDLHNVIVRLGGEGAFVVSLVGPGCRITLGHCFYPGLGTALATAHAGWVGRIAYHQAGSAVILDDRGWPDSQRAFIHPDTSSIDQAGLRTMAELLADLQAASGKELIVVGSFYEPRINLANNQPIRTGWVPRPAVRGQFERLDREMRDATDRQGLAYLSLMTASLAPHDRILDQGCPIYHDLDHFSDCGERRLAAHLLETGHPLVALVMR